MCIEIQWNTVDTDTDGTCYSVRIDRVSVVSTLILEKIFELFLVGTNETTGVRRAWFHCTKFVNNLIRENVPS